ncbi:craniofacial development protein 1 isoform X2 [Stigmatopora argus]
MNCSDDDSDSYVSSEDGDYVPSDYSVSEDDINECVKEDPLNESDVPQPFNMTKRTVKNKDIVRKRSKRDFTKEDEALQDIVGNVAQTENNDEAAKKKTSDSLWAHFLSDVAPTPKPSMASSVSHTTLEAHSSDSNVFRRTASKELDPAKVTIVKVFDFAGEEVRVNKEVSVDSREAKMHLKVQCTEERMGTHNPTSPPHQSTCSQPSSKRPAGMSSLLNRIGGKKQKISTLEKSKMDWDAFKHEEGIADELAIHNRGKDGYVERKNFLERVDHRQFEMEKAVRLKNMKPSS